MTSLAEFEGEASASAQAYEGLVREGSKLLEDKRLSTSRKRQQTASARQETMAERRGHEAGSSAAASYVS